MKQVTIQGKNITFDPDKHQYFLNDRELHGATRISRIVAESDWISGGSEKCVLNKQKSFSTS